MKTAAKGPGRPPIPVLTQKFKAFSPKGASVRFDGDKDAENNPLYALYLNRESFAGLVPEGHIPTEVEVSIRLIKNAPEKA